MAVRIRRFDFAKALETLLFVAEKLQTPTFHSVSKILYFADKEHLEKYGRLIFGDDYVAMKHGPVPSGIYDMMKAPVGRVIFPEPQAEKINEAFDVYNGYCIRIKRQADQNRLSTSEIECLQSSLQQHGTKSFMQLTELSHDQAWNSVDDNDLISIEQIARTLPNADEVLEHLYS